MGPAQFIFQDPDTGLMYGPEKSKKTLLDRIIVYRSQNGLPPIDFLDDVVENYWCMQQINVGRCEPKQLKLGLLATLRGGIAVIKNYMYDRCVDQNVAEERAAKCSSCKHNRKPEDEGIKYWLDLVAINSVKGHRTKEYDNLGTCGVCECPLNMKVFYAGKVPATKDQLAKYTEVNCWQLDILENK